MPRKPAAGLRWISIEISQDDYEILKESARQDQRSLTMFLRIQLSELASELVFKNLVQQAKDREEREKREKAAASATGSTEAT